MCLFAAYEELSVAWAAHAIASLSLRSLSPEKRAAAISVWLCNLHHTRTQLLLLVLRPLPLLQLLLLLLPMLPPLHLCVELE